jgi:poly-gamma-glutamate capsule biosynthesis protein CapA/YwtB (metallophosphatase superfamily)
MNSGLVKYVSLFLMAAAFGVVAYLLNMPPRSAIADEPPLPQTVIVLFGGDMLFDRSIRSHMERKGSDFIFSCLDPLLASRDLVVANLEGPITTSESISQYSRPGDSNNYTFTFPPSTAQILYDHNIRLVNIGNNHIMNFGTEGLLSTRRYLAEAGVAHFGDPGLSHADRVARIHINGIDFSFINWSEWTSGPPEETLTQIALEVESGRTTIVYTHWGEEYVSATNRQKKLAHEFVDAGATMVIGSHPHVVQEKEIYRGKHIYYSLGNFIFDQYWEPAVMQGLLLEVTFGQTGALSIREIPTVLQKDGRTCLI